MQYGMQRDVEMLSSDSELTGKADFSEHELKQGKCNNSFHFW